jgi:hypothetical protein
MSYTITLKTTDQHIGDDTVQLVMQFEVNLTGTDQVLDARSQGVSLADWGQIGWSYDLDDALLTPNTYQVVLNDVKGYLDDLFFGNGSIAQATEKEAFIEVNINGETRFSGYCLEDQIDSDPSSAKTVTLQCAPDTEALNTTNLYKEYEGETKNLNPFRYTFGSKVAITDILQSIFRLVDKDITYPDSLDILQDWSFLGMKQSSDLGGYEPNVFFTDLQLLVDNLFFNSAIGITTVGDLLRTLAFEFGCFVGFSHQKKAFFKRLFYYNPDNLQNVIVLKRTKGYKYPLVNYVEIDVVANAGYNINAMYAYAPDAEAYTDCSNKYIKKNAISYAQTDDLVTFATNIYATCKGTTPRFFKLPESATNQVNTGEVYEHNGSTYKVVGVFTVNQVSPYSVNITVDRISGTNDPLTSGTLTQVSGSKTFSFSEWATKTGDYIIGQVSIPNTDIFDSSIEALAKFLYYYRGDITKLRVDTFIFRGISYDFLKDFNYKGEKFQPIVMTIDIAKGQTTCQALFMGLVG